MSESSLAILLAIIAVVLGLSAIALFYVVVIRQGGNADRAQAEEAAESPERPLGSGPDPAAGRRDRGSRKKKSADKTQRYLFVVFDEPGPDTNRALGQLLKEAKAFYEDALGIYHIPPGPEGYPLTVANASSPGTLPPLHKGDDEHPPVQGVSILIKFINSRSLSRSPQTMIAFTRRIAEIGSGRVLDVDRNPVSDEMLSALHPDDQ
jgi:hypothetical protein